MDMGSVNPGCNPGWGHSHWRQIQVESGLELSCKQGYILASNVNAPLATKYMEHSVCDQKCDHELVPMAAID